MDSAKAARKAARAIAMKVSRPHVQTRGEARLLRGCYGKSVWDGLLEYGRMTRGLLHSSSPSAGGLRTIRG